MGLLLERAALRDLRSKTSGRRMHCTNDVLFTLVVYKPPTVSRIVPDIDRWFKLKPILAR
jgi:hypothetical protein